MEVKALAPYPSEIRILTSLRYVAAIWVVFFHWTAFFPESALASFPLVRSGFLGVDFFFVLSGFVLCHVYLARQEAGKLDYWNFVSRRVARIYPMHLLSLLGMVALGLAAHRLQLRFNGPWDAAEFLALPSGELPREFLAHVLMIHAWGASDGMHFNAPSWSISAEWFVYLTFPLLTALLGPGARRPLATLVITAVAVAAYAVLSTAAAHDVFEMTWNIGVLRIIPGFLLGIALYRFGTTWSAGRKGALLGFQLSLVLAIVTAWAGAPHVFVVLSLGAMILFAADAERHGALKSLCGDFAVLLGEVSYSVYMIHYGLGLVLYGLLLKSAGGAGSTTALGLILFGIALLTFLSWVAHRFFEIPSRTFLNARANAIMSPKLANN